MEKYSLKSEIVAEIVETIAEQLDLHELGLEETEVLTQLVALSVALYLSKLRSEGNNGVLQ